MKVSEAMTKNPITLEPDSLVIEAAKLMKEKKIGSIIILEKEKVMGIVTERDLIRRVMAEGKDPKLIKIKDVMTFPVSIISPKEDIIKASQVMKGKGIRRLVVMEGENLVGIITTNDLVRNMKNAVQDLATSFYMMDLY